MNSSLDIKETIVELVNSHITGENLYLVDVIIAGNNPAKKVLVLLDSDGGLSIDTCASISRKVSADLDEKDILESGYILEVSSPGLEHPLKLHRQYHNHVGKTLKVMLTDESTQEGELLEVLEEGIVLNQSTNKGKSKRPQKAQDAHAILERTQIPFLNIKLTKVLASI